MSGGSVPVLLLHDVGERGGGGGRPWDEALRSAGWDGEVLAPDLPGHAGAPPPEGGQYESSDAAFVAVPLLARLGSPCVVVGVGLNGWNAVLCGLAGKASAVVLVDGTGAPWVTPTEAVLAQRPYLRAIADDPLAVAPMPAGAAVDPRLARHGLRGQRSRKLLLRAAARMPVPLLLLESAASACPAEDAASIAAAAAAAGGGRVVRIDEASPAVVASVLVRELGDQQAEGREVRQLT
jgi:pimeloyl-ACP methyl ester carboxylesterase